MKRTLVILRPEPGATATAERARARGFRALPAALFVIRLRAWTPPDPADFDALLLTSANAVRHAGPALGRFLALPVYAVGVATGEAARAAGFTRIIPGDSDAEALAGRAIDGGVRRALHLAGREHRPLGQAGLSVETRVVYASAAARALPPDAVEALHEGAVALLHSPRAAALFRGLAEAAGVTPAAVRVAAISPAVLAAAGPGWAATATALQPIDDALLDAAARLCDQDAGRDG